MSVFNCRAAVRLSKSLFFVRQSKGLRIHNGFTKFFHSTTYKLNATGLPIKMPALSPTMMEGTIVKWLKNEGDPIQPGDLLCDIQTDKAVVSFETDEEGILAKILIREDGQDIKIGTLIAVMVGEGEDWQNATIPKCEIETAVEPDSSSVAASPTDTSNSPTVSEKFGPSVRLLLENYGLTPSQVPANGPHGRLLKGDVLNFVKDRNLKPQPIVPVDPPKTGKAAVHTPAATVSAPTTPTATVIHGDNYSDIEVTSMRKTIAKRLTQSKSTIAHAYVTLECQIDDLLALRKQMKQAGASVSVNDFIIKAVAVALTKCRDVNCVWQGNQLFLSDSVDISIAVATDAGLITPIVKQADVLGIEEISSTIKELADRGRIGKLKLDEFQGGTFTISNLGMLGITEFSAIINPPQCAILAVGGGKLSLGEDGQPENRMRATLSYDRSAIDDDNAAIFLKILKELLESPSTMVLGSYEKTINHSLAALL